MDSGTQHTTVEQDNIRYIYTSLDELYMVLITNRQSNILQDIDSLHIFAQVVTSICKSLDEREILRNAYELLSAFDELVTLGYRENLSLGQIKTFLEMESNEERIQEIISRVSFCGARGTSYLTLCRTRRWRLRKSERRKPSSSSSNESLWRRVDSPTCLGHHLINNMRLRHVQRLPTPTIATRLKRTSRSSKQGLAFLRSLS